MKTLVPGNKVQIQSRSEQNSTTVAINGSCYSYHYTIPLNSDNQLTKLCVFILTKLMQWQQRVCWCFTRELGAACIWTRYLIRIVCVVCLWAYSPTAGDMEREPLEPVGLGVGLRCGVVARPAPPLPPESLLFWPVRSWNKEYTFLWYNIINRNTAYEIFIKLWRCSLLQDYATVKITLQLKQS